jgi:hypothetical protein
MLMIEQRVVSVSDPLELALPFGEQLQRLCAQFAPRVDLVPRARQLDHLVDNQAAEITHRRRPWAEFEHVCEVSQLSRSAWR